MNFSARTYAFAQLLLLLSAYPPSSLAEKSQNKWAGTYVYEYYTGGPRQPLVYEVTIFVSISGDCQIAYEGHMVMQHMTCDARADKERIDLSYKADMDDSGSDRFYKPGDLLLVMRGNPRKPQTEWMALSSEGAEKTNESYLRRLYTASDLPRAK